MLGFLWELQELNQAVTKQQAVALQAFRTFDLDKDGSLSRDELVRGTVKSMVPKRYPKS
jgi:Ca2+-binding EF-hand superfamily protein